jgi:hypothetical protein
MQAWTSACRVTPRCWSTPIRVTVAAWLVSRDSTSDVGPARGGRCLCTARAALGRAVRARSPAFRAHCRCQRRLQGARAATGAGLDGRRAESRLAAGLRVEQQSAGRSAGGCLMAEQKGADRGRELLRFVYLEPDDRVGSSTCSDPFGAEVNGLCRIVRRAGTTVSEVIADGNEPDRRVSASSSS